ncbi:hypothetical protein [Corynebacterium sp.]|uniref:hypothetical protein n=1 Tax=Corynebacterium sp. TaxID=1720 RepID=UPI0026DBEAA6|nr:hypothetical protein [Corynebacterium sp.]MDO5032699.1 hypothetical protein [Corynebacterium sp.]
MEKHKPVGPRATFTDVQRREVFTELVTKDGVQTLAIEKKVPGGSSKRLLLLNKYDAQKLKEALEAYLNTVYAQEFSGVSGTLSPADMLALFGEEED